MGTLTGETHPEDINVPGLGYIMPMTRYSPGIRGLLILIETPINLIGSGGSPKVIIVISSSNLLGVPEIGIWTVSILLGGGTVVESRTGKITSGPDTHGPMHLVTSSGVGEMRDKRLILIERIWNLSKEMDKISRELIDLKYLGEEFENHGEEMKGAADIAREWIREICKMVDK